MKKCVIMPDSFKGTLSSIEICDIIKEKVLEFYPDCQVKAVPVADGGEGTVDCFLYAIDAEKVELRVQNAYMEPVDVYYAKVGSQAILEMAQPAGLPQAEGRLNPKVTSTYGVGQMIRHAVENGCTDIVIGLGGSSTNDGGAGAAAALGTVFRNAEGESFIPAGGTLKEIVSIDNSETRKLLEGVSITAMCDINNPMYGPQGAAYIFAPQKGADPEMVKELDSQLIYLSELIQKDLGTDVSRMEGAGAAGALGAGIVAFMGGKLKSGIQTVLDMIHFEELAAGADMVFTGEGRIDSQSLGGKVVIGIAERAKRLGVPVTAVVGSIGDGAEGAYELGVNAIFSINRTAEDFSVSRYKSKENLTGTVDSLIRFYMAAGK
ncbi:glycerate kinase [Lactonifactor sp. BIOML-A3]|uniref:glycerate kinase family protein n=1 Tax=unclassified Lactonifactor TaxID=2636670 RepID=UPI0012AF3B41|nr:MULTISPECIES: glycerate kinase [unclassified Lactonifactor]MSA04083.1 glycerate kinase [Lactonifactor sp. BIOML-A5]MSA10687.1 glycerate kinase [Lactonifactor sp. BIOML-A4]MSA15184.1 glycerate kinase [Lactonifactor sp. BIOML-A3]MSA19624.1 glycerate kinase [Lactonifactor sp. BIOML-A2]MSA40263.1 glycerate kinase [Lactonifactor sp. BIOML-A1]